MNYETILSEVKKRLNDNIGSQLRIVITSDTPAARGLNGLEDVELQYLNSDYGEPTVNRENVLVQNRTFYFSANYRKKNGIEDETTLTGQRAEQIRSALHGYNLTIMTDASPLELVDDSALGIFEQGFNVHSTQFRFTFVEAVTI